LLLASCDGADLRPAPDGVSIYTDEGLRQVDCPPARVYPNKDAAERQEREHPMSATPPPSMPLSDPRKRVYNTGDFLVAYETVRPTPMYSGEKLSCVTFRMTPGQVHEPHSHTDITQMWVILSGEGEAILDDGQRERVGPGAVIVHHPTQPHGIVALGPDDLVYINVSEKAARR
jgi:quercetin dioxygenase-like cupin family protein